MTRLTKEMVIVRAKESYLPCIKNLNCWGCTLTDVSIFKDMPEIEVLSLSVNEITTMKPFQNCHKLRELYLRSNRIEDINELAYIQNLPALRILSLEENPMCKIIGPNYRSIVLNALPQLTKLDNVEVTADQIENAERIAETIGSIAIAGELDTSIHVQPQNSVEKFTQKQMSVKPQTTPQETECLPHLLPTRRSSNIAKEKYKEAPIQILSVQATKQPKQYIQYDQPAYNHHDYKDQPEFESYQVKHMQNEYDSLPHCYYEHTHQNTIPSHIDCQYNDRISTSTSLHHQCTGYQRRPINRYSNVLSAILCLIKELNYSSLEVVLHSVRCRLDDIASEQL